jgi:hypothetical protein
MIHTLKRDESAVEASQALIKGQPAAISRNSLFTKQQTAKT